MAWSLRGGRSPEEIVSRGELPPRDQLEMLDSRGGLATLLDRDTGQVYTLSAEELSALDDFSKRRR